MERYEVHGVKVYQLNVCEAIHDHDLCPGITILHAGAFDIGTVVTALVTRSLRTKYPVTVLRPVCHSAIAAR
jgi:hypothetical protein